MLWSPSPPLPPLVTWVIFAFYNFVHTLLSFLSQLLVFPRFTCPPFPSLFYQVLFINPPFSYEATIFPLSYFLPQLFLRSQFVSLREQFFSLLLCFSFHYLIFPNSFNSLVNGRSFLLVSSLSSSSSFLLYVFAFIPFCFVLLVSSTYFPVLFCMY